MSTDELARIAVTAVLGVAVGVVAALWLRSQAYRYADEQDLPSRRTGWVVVACAVLPTLMVLAWPEDPVAVVYAVSTVALVVLAAIDIDVFRLPDVITKPMALALVVALLAVALLTGDTDPWVRALLAGAGLGFCYLVLVFIGGGAGMGLGDAKLALSLGMLLGYQSWSHVVLGSMASFLLAGIAAIYLVLFRGAGRKSHLAFGPYLVAGTILVLVLPAIGRT